VTQARLETAGAAALAHAAELVAAADEQAMAVTGKLAPLAAAEEGLLPQEEDVTDALLQLHRAVTSIAPGADGRPV
jgi:hypothetical protein